MAKKKSRKNIKFEIVSYGIYSEWDNHYKELPKIEKFTNDIPVRLGIEFGYIVNIQKAKGLKIKYCIKHPDFFDSKGEIAPDFTGEVMINSNNWFFFLGDTVWEPIEDKVGEWQVICNLNGENIADMKFNLYQLELLEID